EAAVKESIRQCRPPRAGWCPTTAGDADSAGVVTAPTANMPMEPASARTGPTAREQHLRLPRHKSVRGDDPARDAWRHVAAASSVSPQPRVPTRKCIGNSGHTTLQIGEPQAATLSPDPAHVPRLE